MRGIRGFGRVKRGGRIRTCLSRNRDPMRGRRRFRRSGFDGGTENIVRV
jgi:hypothetical protein